MIRTNTIRPIKTTACKYYSACVHYFRTLSTYIGITSSTIARSMYTVELLCNMVCVQGEALVTVTLYCAILLSFLQLQAKTYITLKVIKAYTLMQIS